MNQAEKAELLEQIEKWNDADEFARCIEAIEAIPEQERDYLLTLKLGRAYSNLAVLGDHGALGENAEVDGDLLRHAIDLLESVRTQGENDPYWNARMGYSCLMAYSSAATAYEYAKRWLALLPDDPAAQKLVRDCEEYLEEEKALELDSKVGSRGGAIDYSLLLDGLMAEREQGITIDVAYRYFTTDNRSFIVADTPGHEEYTRNMAVGASFADLAVILVDASQGVLVQTRRHARICALMGIRYFVFAVNKMDLIGYDEKRFREIENQIAALVEELKLANVTIIPVSATEGDNVTTKSDNMPWYEGEALLTHLETVDIKEDTEKGFYMPVQRVCRPNHEFRGFQGQIENGSIKVGDLVTTLPSKEEAHVKSILVGDKEAEEAVQGQPVTIQLDREVDVSRGCVLTIDSGAVLTDSVEADILWMDDNALTDGKNFFVKIGTKMIPGLVTKINYSVDVNTGEKKNAYTLNKNEIASCTLEFSEKIVVDEFDKHRTLGELILIDRVTNMTSACGVVRKTLVSQDKSQIGKVDEQVRAGLKGQTPVVVEFPIGKEGITLEFAEQVEKGLTVLGRHTYLYHPAASENYAETVRYLKAAGLIVLLVLDENTAKDETLKGLDGFYTNWQLDGLTVKDAVDFVKKKSVFAVQNAQDGNYI